MRMSNITTAVSYTVSGGSAMFWLDQLINSYTHEQWAAIGVIGSLFFMALTFLFNAGVKIWDRRHGYKPKGEQL